MCDCLQWDVLLEPSCLTVNVGVVLPLAVDVQIQPNAVGGKLATVSLRAHLTSTVGNIPVELVLSPLSGMLSFFLSLSEKCIINGGLHFISERKAKILIHLKLQRNPKMSLVKAERFLVKDIFTGSVCDNRGEEPSRWWTAGWRQKRLQEYIWPLKSAAKVELPIQPNSHRSVGAHCDVKQMLDTKSRQENVGKRRLDQRNVRGGETAASGFYLRWGGFVFITTCSHVSDFKPKSITFSWNYNAAGCFLNAARQNQSLCV